MSINQLLETNDLWLSVPAAVRRLQAGQMVLLCDDETREHEADLCLAAQFATPERINFMLQQARGLLCVALAGERLDALGIPLAERANAPLQDTAFTASVDARRGTTTGVSARDRALTARLLVDPTAQPEDFARPGHLFPLRAHPAGTLGRRGHTEGAVDLMRLAGLEPGAVICEVLDEEGEPARGATLLRFAQRHGLGLITVDAIARFRREQRVILVNETRLPLPEGDFHLRHYRDTRQGRDYLALILGELDWGDLPPLVRLHSACTTGEVFGSQRCDCQAQLRKALALIGREGRGLLLYLPQEGRGIGLAGKLHAYRLQDNGYDTVEANERLGYPADARSYDDAVAILAELGLRRLRLLTNNPAKLQALQNADLQVERVALEIAASPENRAYLDTRRRRLGHLLSASTEPDPGAIEEAIGAVSQAASHHARRTEEVERHVRSYQR
ncbi:GTP cyclohydrolase II [Thermogemmatispora tikiterensis]|uniref:GTP cyclohydrolase-2 n=1 Tax=Thermogemmatispora tikiterensis TaxID=1825093 RepID=A0A328VQR4_9CHLR|nr:GTP cyclohydrolase II [Thermogemmatispora tikiterensis]RAQ97574.1 bifunctional 3,4-dihydroxy-2-butanone 4-phosphate synthase/GTP cyclohydrolase II [Thermogemmatispora tikiterensis]